LKITDYSFPLLNDLEIVNWPKGTKLLQKHWIGKKEGSEISFPILKQSSNDDNILYAKGESSSLTVFNFNFFIFF